MSASSEYTLRGVSTVDVAVALECEADRAQREQFPGVAGRQRELALHLRNAERTMRELTPAGHRVQMDITFKFVPNVNPVLKPEFWSDPS